MKLEVKKGGFRYTEKENMILSNLHFSADKGDILAILGPNGAGKTTLLRCTMGLLRWNEGISELDGQDMRKIPYRELWKTVSYVPQARHTTGAYTVEEMVLIGRSSRIGKFGTPGKKDIKKSNEVIDKLNLTKIRKKYCSEISGGELQMVLIARALASDPRILILDEPESNLDFKNQLIVLDTMSELAAEGLTFIFNTHYPAHALRRANKALMLSKNGEYLFGSTGKIVTEESIAKVFGVHAIIGEIETPCNIYQNVFPVAPDTSTNTAKNTEKQRVIASLSVITGDRSESEKINTILHSYRDSIIGRMGMPYPDAGVFIINLTLDDSAMRVRELTDCLNMLPGISVKTTYARELKQK